MTVIYWHNTDWHVNNKRGLRIPRQIMDEGDETIISPGQRFLWRSLLDQQEIITELAKKYKAEVWAGFGGDLCELDIKQRTVKIHTRNTATIEAMTTETMRPVIDISRRAFFCAGTIAHVGDAASSEELIANHCTIAATVPGTKDKYIKHIADQWLIDCEGVRLLIQHHGKLGKLPWTRANPLNQKAARLMLEWGRNLPDVFIQGHNHVYETASKAYPIMVIAAPGMCLPTENEYRNDSDAAKIGGLYFVCREGKIIDWDAMLYEPGRVQLWQPK